jgi:Ni,Fe-hydrogenase I cytochrome b subunit
MSPPSTSVAEGARPPHHAELERVYVWDLVVRLSHWIIMLALLLLAVTGIYIG